MALYTHPRAGLIMDLLMAKETKDKARFNSPVALAIAFNITLAVSHSSNNSVRLVDPTGVVTTI
jgi:hypothetical protein